MDDDLRTEPVLCALGRGRIPPEGTGETGRHGERLAKVVESGRRARRSDHGAINTWPRDTEPMEDSMPRKPTASERYWSKVTKTTTCWVWTASLNRYGRGLFKMHGRKYQAHRLTFEATYGQVQGYVAISVRCGTAACVRPDHLRLRPMKPRIADGTGSERPMGSCVHGQAFTPDSLLVNPPDGRGCQECIALYPPRHAARAALDLAHPDRVNSGEEDGA